ncbi:substrate-binding periplasmic protein [Psychromonas aquimarina]|uniref:substrate-binding periplasmic protein n=1 Tax=Psychromonas aquimarina TaxID=444919 RepID=UPI00040881D2|nr:transporter substrate-binding domain-containing protein [Psychromonas aquimarina]
MIRNMIAAVFFLLVIILIRPAAAEIKVTVYADDNYPPYSYLEKGQLKGIYSDIFRAAFDKMRGYKVTIEAVPWKRGLKLLENGKGFALYPPYFHALKRPYIWPYSLPVLDERVVVFCSEEILTHSIRNKWPEDYYGLTIGNNAGFNLGGEKFWQAVKDKKINVYEAKGNRENILMLALGRTDCYMNDRLSILWGLKKLKHQKVYDEGGIHSRLLQGTTITIEQGFLGYTSRDNGKFVFKDDFKKKLDIIIYEMRKTGELQDIIDAFMRR